MKLNILTVTAMYPRPGHEGYGAFVMQQVEELRSQGHTVDLVNFPGYRSKFEYLKAALEVFRRTRRNRYDVVHAHYGVTGLSALFRNSTPLVISLHGSDMFVGRLGPLISQFVSRRAEATIVVNQKMAERIPGVIIPCGVDLDRFKPKPRSEARRQLGLPKQKRLVLFPFHPARRIKRFDLAQAALRRLTDAGIDSELLSVSNVPNRDMPWYYSAADVMILCSNSEGSPTSVKEALACNLPVVSTNVGDVTEILQGIEGVQIVEQNPDALAAALIRVFDPPPGFVFDGRSAMQRYSQPATVQAILRVYQRAMETGMSTRRFAKHREISDPGQVPN